MNAIAAAGACVSLAAKSAERNPTADRLDITLLFEENASFVRTLASQLLGPGPEADDVVQEVFLVAWRKLKNFEGTSVRGWLTRITAKVAAATRRRSWWRCRFDCTRVGGPSVPPPDRDLEVSEAAAIFAQVASGLSFHKRTALVLADIHGLSGPEIAKAMRCPLKTVYTRLFYARREFVARLTAAGYDTTHLKEGVIR